MYTLLFWIIFLPVFYFILRKFLYPPGSHIKPSTTPENGLKLHTTKDKWSFVAMRYYNLILNRTFRIWVTDKYLFGVRVNHAIGAPLSTDVDPKWQDPEYYVNPGLDNKYQNSVLNSGEFLTKDKANFRILRSDIIKIDYYPTKWGMGTVPYSGRLVIVTKEGKNVELILLGKQDHRIISRHLLEK